MTLYYYMYRSWQDCCRRGENRSWPSVSVESLNSEYWCLNNAIVYAFIMRLTVEEGVLRSTFKLNALCMYVCIYIYIHTHTHRHTQFQFSPTFRFLSSLCTWVNIHPAISGTAPEIGFRSRSNIESALPPLFIFQFISPFC